MTLSVPFLRTELLGCYSDQDFLAKLHCVRQAFEVGVVQEPLGESAGPASYRATLCLAMTLPFPLALGGSHSLPSFLRGF